MEDQKIVELYWKRDERAITATQEQYGSFLLTLAMRVLSSEEDGREVVNDTYLRAWNAIPPHRPEKLRAFLGRIARQGAIDRLRHRLSARQQVSEYTLSLEELGSCLAEQETPESYINAQELARAVSDYLRSLPARQRQVFVCRYWFFDSIREIGAYFGASESKIKSMLYRTRQGLREYLYKEGFLP